MTYKKTTKHAAVALCFAILTSSCSNAEQKPHRPLSSSSSLNLKTGQYLSIILPEAKPNAGDARKAYYKQAFPLGEQFGLKREASLNVDDVIISNYKPSALIFYSYPNKAAEGKLANHVKWPEIKAQRSKAWDELKIYSATIDQDLNLEFDPAKSYTLVVAWLDPENPDDYDRYLSGIEEAVDRFGGRFIYKMKNPKYEAHASAMSAPGQLTFVEWDTLDGFTKVRTSDEYKASAAFFASGTTKVEFYRLSVPDKK